VLHTLLLIIAGLILVGVFSAVLEQLGMRNHPYAARLLAAVSVTVGAYTHTWVRLLIGICFALAYLMVRREWQIRTSGR
jgi:energy-coupling factor transporter transmembrane protein EcfT